MYDLLIRESRAPARVRGALDRLMATGEPLPLVDEDSLRRFVRVVESSRFAVDVLRAYPEAWSLLEDGVLPPRPEDAPSSAAALRARLALDLFGILVADILELVPFEETLGMLSRAASACVQGALDLAAAELAERYGTPPPGCGYCVLGMGKLGGGELNFSSDIDLICFYGEDGESSGGSRGRLEAVEWHTRATEKIVDLISARAHGPVGLKVDLRLRPEGKTGPLVRSLDSMLRYYESEGTTWERQALIKARPIAGDRALGERLLEAVSPFVYRRFLDRDAIYAVEAIKGRIEAQARAHGRRHVKLSRGGIREIEFITQLLQLANGGRCPAVRVPGTLGALDALVDHRYLLGSDRDRLRSAYLFLRRVEHRLQMLDGRQTHVLPEDEGDVADLAIRLDYPGADEFWADYIRVTDAVRSFYDQRFARSREVAVAPIESAVIALLEDPEQDGEGTRAPSLTARDALLDRLGAESIGELRALSRGSVADPRTSTIRRLFIQSTPAWLPALLELPDPDRGLKRFARIIECYGAKATIFEILAAHEPVAALLVGIASLSEPLTDLICRDPSTLEALLSPGGVTGDRDAAALRTRADELARHAPSRERALRMLRSEEHLRIGVRFLAAIADASRSGREMAAMAELFLEDCPEAVVIALGRFGAGDLGLASDLDLVFLAPDGSEGAAQAVPRRIADWTRAGFKIDSRLRPMGRTAPLVVDVETFARYVAETAETWERVAWARARVVAGPREACAEVERVLARWRERAFTREDVATMVAMRRRLLEEAAPGDLKRGRGGLIDIDLMTSMRRLRTNGSTVDPEVVFRDEPAVVEAHRFLRAWDAAAQFAFGRAWRGDEGDPDRERHAVLMRRHGLDPERLAEVRRNLAAAWDAEVGM